MNVLLFASLILYFAASVLQFLAVAAKKDFLHRIARWVMAAGFLSHTAFTVWRGFAAGRLPLANQFEFASAFAWAVTLMGFLLYRKLGQEGVLTIAMPAAFLILSYAAFQPREIKELMPALRSVWFGLHIGSAAFSYAAFAIAGGLGVGYLMKFRKVADQQDPGLKQMDYLAYRMICLGFLLLTVVIFSGAIWAEQAMPFTCISACGSNGRENGWRFLPSWLWYWSCLHLPVSIFCCPACTAMLRTAECRELSEQRIGCRIPAAFFCPAE